MKRFFVCLLLVFTMVIGANILIFASDEYGVNLNTTNTYNYNSEHVVNAAHYNLSERNNESVSDEVLLTVITHGLGGNSSHWSYNEVSDDKKKFGYEEDTIITNLVITLDYDVRIIRCNINKEKIRIDDFTSSWGATSNSRSPILMVFETEQSYYSNDYVYSQFDLAVSSVVKTIKDNNDGLLPKINLIGHSRGGLINLLYAMDHPDMVNQIFSIGTPYEGSTTATIDVDYYGCQIGSNIYIPNGKDGEKDIINTELYTSYLTRWNSGYDTYYSNIEVHALGADMKYSFLMDLLRDESVINKVKEMLAKDDETVSTENEETINKEIVESYLNKAIKLLNFLNNRYLVTQAIIFTASAFVLGIMDIFAPLFKNKYPMQVLVEQLATCIAFETNIKGKGKLIWENDGLVDLDSALGTNYYGFIRQVKHFTFDNCDINRRADQNQIPLVHNLETKDETFINYIASNIKCNGKVNNPYMYSMLSDGTLRIDNYIGNAINIDVPSEINGHEVTQIDDGAFAGCSAETINIPSSIKQIGQRVFIDSTELKTVNIYGELNSFGYEDSFIECEKLENINIYNDNSDFKTLDGVLYTKALNVLLKYPSGRPDNTFDVPMSVNSISGKSFIDAINLTSIVMNSVKRIDYKSFEGCYYLENISAPSVILASKNAFTDTSWYYNQEEGIISIGKTIIGYNASDENANVVLSNDETAEFETIGENAFEGITELEITISDSVNTICKNAFYGVDSLDISVMTNYGNINDILNGVTNLKFRCIKELKQYYLNYVDDVYEFDGVSNNRIYKVIQFYHYFEDENVYIGDIDINQYYTIYREVPFLVENLNCKDNDTKLLTYVIDGLYEDASLKNRYSNDIITIDDAAYYYVKWKAKKYSVIYHLEGGKTLNGKDEYIETISFYNPIGFVVASKPYCFNLEKFRGINDNVYYDSGDYNIKTLFYDGILENDVVNLYAIWQPYRYSITYHEQDKEYSGGYYNYYEPHTFRDAYVAGTNFFGWYSKEFDIKYESTAGLHEDLDLYGMINYEGDITINATYVITDSGRYKQKYDSINLFVVLGIGISKLKEMEYDTVSIKIVITLKEIDNGTQYIFLYSRAASDDKYLIDTIEINDASSKYKEKEYNLTINLSDIESDMLFIRFGASGSFNDDWSTKSREYSFVVSRED